MTKSPAPRVSWVLLVVLVAALATGAAASILVSAATAPPNPPGASLTPFVPQWLLSVLAVLVLAAFAMVLVIYRLAGGRSSVMSQVTVSLLVGIFVLVLFVIAVRELGVGGPIHLTNSGGGGGGGSSSNNTQPSPGGTVGGPGGQIVLFPNVPAWVPFVFLAAIVLVAALIVVPGVRRVVAVRRDYARRALASPAEVPPEVREALVRASAELDLGADPRVVILALYRTMLEHLQPMVEDLGTSTPEEIRSAHLVRLGVRPDAARTLTRLFEEARYSTHPLGPATSARAQEALRATLDDLDRRTVLS